jgi:hypothetical protein
MDNQKLIGALAILFAVLLLASFLWFFLFRRKQTADLKHVAAKEGNPDEPVTAKDWDPDDALGSLRGVADAMEAAANDAAEWYWREKGPAARASRFIQAGAVFLTAAAGLVPVAVELVAKYIGASTIPWWVTGLWASVLLGAAGALFGLDRAFGFSSAWTRYVLAATDITRRLAEFNMAWLSLVAAVPKGATLTSEQIATFMQAATNFRVGVVGVVVQETKEWATEFQNNLAQLEKDIKAQLEALKVQVEEQRKEREASNQPGSIEATIPNADKAKDATFRISLEGPDGVAIVKDESVTNSKTWSRLGLKANQYKLTLVAESEATSGAPKFKSTVVTVKPGEVAKTSVDLALD